MKGMIELQKIHCCNCLDLMARMPDGFVDLTVTSPPYDNLRTYNGYEFDFEPIARELYRVTKKGGVVVWVVGDATINGSETGTSFRQALYFKEIGFNLHDTMIYHKPNPTPQHFTARYTSAFEFMFVLARDGVTTCNPLTERTLSAGTTHNRKPREYAQSADCRTFKTTVVKEEKIKSNVWNITTGGELFGYHPGVFPEALARDHILSWSNENDLVYDPFMGSGTTAKAAHQLKRRWIGSEISQEYVDLANKRLEPYLMQEQLF